MNLSAKRKHAKEKLILWYFWMTDAEWQLKLNRTSWSGPKQVSIQLCGCYIFSWNSVTFVTIARYEISKTAIANKRKPKGRIPLSRSMQTVNSSSVLDWIFFLVVETVRKMCFSPIFWTWMLHKLFPFFGNIFSCIDSGTINCHDSVPTGFSKFASGLKLNISFTIRPTNSSRIHLIVE